MALIDDQELLENNKASMYLLKNSQQTRAQEAQLLADIAALKGQVKGDVMSDTYNPPDLRALADNLDLSDSIVTKKAQLKTELQTMRGLITDPGYQAELYAEEQLL